MRNLIYNSSQVIYKHYVSLIKNLNVKYDIDICNPLESFVIKYVILSLNKFLSITSYYIDNLSRLL